MSRPVNEDRNIFLKICDGATRESRGPNKEVETLLYIICKINPKWIKNLSVGAKTIKHLEKKKGINLCDLGLGNDCLYITSKVQATKEKNRKKIKNLSFKGHRQESENTMDECH